MTTASYTILITLCGLLAVTIIDSIGSIASRRLKFNYGWFTILSVTVYIAVPFLLAKVVSFEVSVLSNLIIGFYDATVGYKISIKLQANTGEGKEEKMSTLMLLLIMGFAAFIFCYIGYTIGKWLLIIYACCPGFGNTFSYQHLGHLRPHHAAVN